MHKMIIMFKLCNFGTIYLWIFVWKVLQVCADQRMPATAERVGGQGGSKTNDFLKMKPYPYQTMFHYTDDLLRDEYDDGRSWKQIPAKTKQHPVYGRVKYQLQPIESGSEFEKTNNGFHNSLANDEAKEIPTMTSSEITLENLNDFNLYKMANAIWPPQKLWPDNGNRNRGRCSKQQHQEQVRHRFPLSSLLSSPTNILYNGIGDRGKRHQYSTEKDETTKTSWLDKIDDDDDVDDNGDNDNGVDSETNDENGSEPDAKKSVFPYKDADTNSVAKGNAVISNPNPKNGNENENLNYSDSMEEAGRNNYLNDFNNVKDATNSIAAAHQQRKRAGPLRDKKPKQDLTTPYLPAISGGSMVNLGKFFRDLSKNVQFSEKYQWSSDEQKLLEGDPTFGDLHHHLTDPDVNSERAGEWIKAIRFYRPSQKIRSLVEMNPHGQWAHGSNFIDPNYMWMGLGK